MNSGVVPTTIGAPEKMFWQGRRVLVTGHTGFMGSWLVTWLGLLGARVTGIGLPPATEPALFEVSEVSAYLEQHFVGDIRDQALIQKAFSASEPEIVFHLAAQAIVREGIENALETFDVNVMGTAHILEAIRATPGVRAAIIVTTDKVYDNREWEWEYRENDRLGGHEPYGASKACAELVVDAYARSFLTGKGIAVSTIRAGNIIGGGDWSVDRLVPDIVRAFAAGKRVSIRNPDSIRPWQHVLEPLRGYLLLAERMIAEGPSHGSDPWNFGPSHQDHKPVSWIVQKCAELWGNGAAWVEECDNRAVESRLLALTSAKAEARLNWTPLWGLEAALSRALDWYQAYYAGANMRDFTCAQIQEISLV
jgi:CDP-glucose 4,6-dehydratase